MEHLLLKVDTVAKTASQLAHVIEPNNYVAFTFFIGTMAMMAASVFFFFEVNSTSEKWRTSVLVSGLITFIAAVHYYYMRGYNLETGGDSPTFFRYVDWILTVPLMCVEFYLITKKAGAKINLLWKLIFASVIMLVTGYFGEAVDKGHAAIWGLLSGLAYFYIVYEVWMGDVAKLSKASSPSVQKAVNSLLKFVVIGWAIYPIGYMIGTADGQWYSFMANLGWDMDIIYNIGDAVNKIGFGLVIYALSRNND
jgi:bacteriorhodopsin